MAAAATAAAETWARITVPYIAQRPVMRGSRDGGKTFPRQSGSGYRYEVALRPELPNRPTTVPTGDRETGTTRIMVLDLDTSRVPPAAAADRSKAIEAVAERAAALIDECGGRSLIVASPSGGRHVYVFWAAPRPFNEVRLLIKALARRFHPVVDTSPMEHTDGQIRGPGSPHKSVNGRMTGYMRLTCSLAQAEAICARPCGADVWDALHVELAAELEAIGGGSSYEARHAQAPDAPLDTHCHPYWPRLGGHKPLAPTYAEIARTGRHSGLYPSSSEARQAILCSAAARGWRLHQVQDHLQPGRPWAAIADWWRDTALLVQEWRKAVEFTAPDPDAPPSARPPSPTALGNSVYSCNTSGKNLTPPLPTLQEANGALAPGEVSGEKGQERAATARGPYVVKDGVLWGLDIHTDSNWQPHEYQKIRTWQNALVIVERLLELEWGRRALSYRAILRAIGAAAQMTGSTIVEFGTRQLAYAAGVDHTTVSRALRVLRDGPYALIDKVADAQGVRADLYQLVIPDAVAAEAAWRKWRAGRIEAIHPAFRALGHPAAAVYEALSGVPLQAHELAAAALLPRSTTHRALQILASHGLAERPDLGGWRRGSADLDVVALVTGAAKAADAQLAGHRSDRDRWHTYLGIIADVPEPATIGHTQTREAGRQRPLRRRAPSWLMAPPRTRPITEGDLLRPLDIDPAELAGGVPTWESLPELHDFSDIPPDVAAIISEENRLIAADDRTPTQEIEYQNVLREFRLHQAQPEAAASTIKPQAGRRWSGSTRGRPPDV
ncbi:helix-turn-helix domain-containing protein [Actinomadura geliboluensis]|uniref:helix-turn-helix domain-containing protein n=1 Tax=Actinomadura geliboluensis TaxID=882440 RepID=UPI003715094D